MYTLHDPLIGKTSHVEIQTVGIAMNERGRDPKI
jgi:hypothetical protein